MTGSNLQGASEARKAAEGPGERCLLHGAPGRHRNGLPVARMLLVTDASGRARAGCLALQGRSMVVNHRKVVARCVNGRIVKGFTFDFGPSQPRFHVFEEPSARGPPPRCSSAI
jgi:hypothetical protein